MSAAAAHDEEALSLRTPIIVSAALHLVVAALVVLGRRDASVPMPPTYRVNLVAAPPGPRQIGVVQPTPPAPTPPTPAPPSRATPEPSRMKAPSKATAKRAPKTATPTAGAAPKPATPAPAAGGGPTGGRGADVANVTVDGIAFPYPAYLENVVRQIAIRFKPPGNARALQAVVAFLIRRDGSVTGIRLTTRSGVYGFDTEAMGAVEAASRSFGPLPQGFSDDVLPVIFSFDPRLIR
ncbi:MAG TPA: TonB family protein [Gemmatimonadaceae bacterium]